MADPEEQVEALEEHDGDLEDVVSVSECEWVGVVGSGYVCVSVCVSVSERVRAIVNGYLVSVSVSECEKVGVSV